MIKHFITKRSKWALFLFLVIKPLVTVYHRYAIFLRPISPSSKKIWVASLNKHNSCKLNYYHPICSIIVVNRTFMSTLQPKTNRCNSDFSFIKKAGDPHGSILFERCPAQTLVMLYISTQYTNKCETILQTKPFIAFLNRSSGKNRRQKQSRESSRAKEIN